MMNKIPYLELSYYGRLVYIKLHKYFPKSSLCISKQNVVRFQVVDARVEEFLAKTAINMRLEQYIAPVSHIIRIGVVYDIFEMQ